MDSVGRNEQVTEIATAELDCALLGLVWQRHLLRELSAGGLHVADSSSYSSADGFHRFPLVDDGGVVTGTTLCVEPRGDSVSLFVLGPCPPEVRSALMAALDQAEVAVAEHQPYRIGWFGVLGCESGWFADPFLIGPYRLEPASRRLRDWVASKSRPSLGSTSVRDFCLLKMTGELDALDAFSAAARAGEDAVLVAGILALAIDRVVVVRQAPAPTAPGGPTPMVDAIVDMLNERQTAWLFAGGQPMSTYGLDDFAFQGPPLEPPGWLDSAWATAQSKPWMCEAIATYLQGISVEQDHPSLASVAFVAVIEAVGTRLFELETCSCGQHTDARIRFRETVDILGDGGATKLLDDYYATRSRLVHQGRLPGPERSSGAVRRGLGGLTDYDPRAVFEVRILTVLRRVAGRLLNLALQGGLPGRRTLPAES